MSKGLRHMQRSLVAIAAFGCGCLAACGGGQWEVTSSHGGQSCSVSAGATRETVARQCGAPDTVGWQPKVVEMQWLRMRSRACSAPGDVYGDHVVLYGCDGRVRGVAMMPAEGFVAPPSVGDLVAQLAYSEQRQDAAHQLAKRGAEAREALPTLRQYLSRETEPEVRAAISEAISAIEGVK